MTALLSRTLAAALLASFVPGSSGHGLLVFPPLRGGTKGFQGNGYCPHCGNGGGVCGDGGQWQSSDFLGAPESPKASFEAGTVAEFEVKITAHHKGHFEFSICDQQLSHSSQNAEGCLSRHKLRRASPPSDCVPNDSRGDCQPVHEKYPERWYLPPGTGNYKMRFEIPSDLQCAACTLQWQWWTANSCVPGADYGCYKSQMKSQGWDADSWFGAGGSCSSSLLQANASRNMAPGCGGEEFRNCADISVTGGGGASPMPTPAPTTASTTAAPSPTPASSTAEPEPEVEPETEPEPEAEPEPQPTMAPKPQACGECSGCIFSNGVCYETSESYCKTWAENVWCGSAALMQTKGRRVRSREHRFLGLLQTGGVVEREPASEEL